MGLGFVAGPLARYAAVCRKSFVFSSFQFFTYKEGFGFAFSGGALAPLLGVFAFVFSELSTGSPLLLLVVLLLDPLTI